MASADVVVVDQLDATDALAFGRIAGAEAARTATGPTASHPGSDA